MATSSIPDRDALAGALVEAFPARPLTRELLTEPAAAWEDYREGDIVQELAGKTWLELDHAFLDRHHSALRYAGPAGFAALLPAYLRRLVEQPAFNEMPFVVAGELKRYGDPTIEKIFDERIARLDSKQRATVKRVIESLTTRAPMEAAMAVAFESYWRSYEETV